MTVEHVLHKLWSNSKSDLERDDAKRLWMLLSNFVQKHGGLTADAAPYDVRGGRKSLEEIKAPK